MYNSYAVVFLLSIVIIVHEEQIYAVNPLGPHDALKHHFTSLKSDLISLQLGF